MYHWRRPIGAYVNKQLAKAGHNIVIHYHQSEQAAKELQTEITAMGVECKLWQADLSVHWQAKPVSLYFLSKFQIGCVNQ